MYYVLTRLNIVPCVAYTAEYCSMCCLQGLILFHMLLTRLHIVPCAVYVDIRYTNCTFLSCFFTLSFPDRSLAVQLGGIFSNRFLIRCFCCWFFLPLLLLLWLGTFPGWDNNTHTMIKRGWHQWYVFKLRLFNHFLLKQATVFTYESSKTNEFSMILAKTPAEIEQSHVHLKTVLGWEPYIFILNYIC